MTQDHAGDVNNLSNVHHLSDVHCLSKVNNVENTVSDGTAGTVFQARTLNLNVHLDATRPAPPHKAEPEPEHRW